MLCVLVMAALRVLRLSYHLVASEDDVRTSARTTQSLQGANFTVPSDVIVDLASQLCPDGIIALQVEDLPLRLMNIFIHLDIITHKSGTHGAGTLLIKCDLIRPVPFACVNV
jgi:hypothetical protein